MTKLRLIRGYRRLTEKVGFTRQHIYGMIQVGTFPQPIQLGPNSVAWIESEVDQWIMDKARARNEQREYWRKELKRMGYGAEPKRRRVRL